MRSIDRRAVLNAGVALAAGVVTPVEGLARQATADFREIDAALQRAVSDGDVLGVAAMGATAEGLVYRGTAGRANAKSGAAMRDDTVFWLMSMTKAFTATAAMQLVEQGRMHLDQPAATILPELAAPQILTGFDAAGQPILRAAKRPITVRHLLTHTSGFTYSIWSEAITRYQKVTGTPDIGTCRNAAFAVPLEFEPGERWEYGISLDWVGKLIEAVSDQSLEIRFRETIFAPLGMQDSGFLIGNAQERRVATFAARQPDGTLRPTPFKPPQRPEFFMGGGGAFSTPRDYMRFLRMLLNGGALDGARLLQPATVAQMMSGQIGDLRVHRMHTAHPDLSRDFDQFPDQPHTWGLSFDINRQAGSNGRAGGSISWAGLLNCYFWLDPVRKVTGALFTQILPFYDARVVALYGAFERGLYRGVGRNVTR